MQFDNRNFTVTAVSTAGAEPDAAREQVARVLASNTFHASEVLRRLLKFLAEKTFSGEADELKEYSVGLDALGKPPTYDPRQDAAVRLHASRLRQKLDDYYRNEGKNDLLIVELPKGRFKIAWHTRNADLPSPPAPAQPPAVSQTSRPADEAAATTPNKLRIWRNLAVGSMAAAILLAFVAVWSLTWGTRTPSAATTPELDAIWNPFLSNTHHLIIAFVNPLYVRLQRKEGGDVVYRTSGNSTWNDVTTSPELPLLKKVFGDAVATPTFNLVERSNLISTFVLTQFFARRRSDISLARADEVSWQQFADNDVIVFGPLIDDGQSALPVKPLLAVEKTGIRNLRPQAGEPAFYPDPANHHPIDGEALELVSVFPGPLGRTTVVTFSGNNKWAVIGGVQSLTDPTFARVVVKRLKEHTGKMPRYYQIVLKFKYRDGTLTHVSYLTHRELAMAEGSTTITEK